MHRAAGEAGTGRQSAATDDAGKRALFALIGITLLSLVVRLWGLSDRIFHWDEGRVGYWILRYHETGQFQYRPIIHGPFIQHVDALLFHVVPATDFWARFPVAVVAAGVPLTAWLLRRHLDEIELVALGLLLTLDPLLLYYSRFMRSDALVGAFAFAAFALLVRAYDTRRPWLGYAAVVSLAFAFGSKENALVYVLCLGGAAVLLYDHHLVQAASREVSVLERVRTDLARTWGWVEEASGRVHPALWLGGGLAGALLVFITIIVLLYAPRPEIWSALDGPGTFVNVVEAGTLGAAERFADGWLDAGHRDHPYFAFVHDMLETLVYGSPVLLLFALLGFAVDGYGGDARGLVTFTAYWGAVSVIGYPVATDIQAPWAAFHVVLPLAVPAAVGAATLVRFGERGVQKDDRAVVAVAALLLTAGAGGVVAANADYWNSAAEEDRQVVQWAQPGNDLQPTLAVVEAVARENTGTDVLLYGDQFHVANESSLDQPPPGGPSWHGRLPLPWYFERAGAELTSVPSSADPGDATTDAPPVVIAKAKHRGALEPQLDGYAAAEHPFKLWGERIVVFVDRGAMNEAGVSL
jgi:uncharacterized protein (TIGR03663 family)